MIHVISDLHIGDGGDADEFRGGEKDLLAYLKTIPDHSLVLNGDIFELLKFEMQDIVHAYADLILEIFKKAIIYIAGNHDRSMLNSSLYAPQYLCTPIARHAIIGDTLFMHGHQLDPVNDDTHLLGDTITQAAGWIAAELGGGTNEALRRLEALAREIGRDGDPSYYRISALNFIEHFVTGIGYENALSPAGGEPEERVYATHLKRVVIGHTHIFDHGDFNGRFEYWNSGCWIGGARDRVDL